MTPPGPIERVVILGGGTAGWMVAAAASRFLNDGQRRITLIESDRIGTIGVGEATIPPIRHFNAQLGIDEAQFVAATGATFKLGIAFDGWGAPEGSYIHPFGDPGHDFGGIDFHRIWLRHRDAPGVRPLEDHWMSAVAANAARFDHPQGDRTSPLSQLAYAYHFDAALYAAFLRRYAQAGGVERIEGTVATVERDGGNGHVAALVLDDGRQVAGDLFVDCSGFRALLIGETMGVEWRDWSRWLPCDRAIAVPSARADGPLRPLTRSVAHDAGWRWRIPLQHRTGNGIVYASAHCDDAEAERRLLDGLDTLPEDEPRRITFTTGMRERLWEGNVVAIGLAAGFLEPLESTSIHLVQAGLQKLFALFPDRGFATVERDEYNRLMTAQFETVRDFVILHYLANGRRGEPFWDGLRAMDPPASLAARLALFAEKGRLFRHEDDLFSVPSWAAVLIGQGQLPRAHDPLVDALDPAGIRQAMASIADTCAQVARVMPDHAAFLQRLGARQTGAPGSGEAARGGPA